MSRKAIDEFRNQLTQSADLQAKARDLNIQGLVALAKENGFEIEAPALNEFLGEIQNEQLELTDFELEIVAGGGKGTGDSASECNCL